MIKKLRIPESTTVRVFPKLHLVAPGAAKPESILTWRHLDFDGFLLGRTGEDKKMSFGPWVVELDCKVLVRMQKLGWPFRGSSSSGEAEIAAKCASPMALGRSWTAKMLQLSLIFRN